MLALEVSSMAKVNSASSCVLPTQDRTDVDHRKYRIYCWTTVTGAQPVAFQTELVSKGMVHRAAGDSR